MSAHIDTNQQRASLIVKRHLTTPEVEKARAELLAAFDAACAQSGLTRDEAEGRLSLFVAYLWDDLEPIVRRLPREKTGRLSRFGIAPEPKPRRKTGKRGRPSRRSCREAL